MEAKVVQALFRGLHFEYSGMSGKMTGFKYDKAKDSIRWRGLKPKDYIPLLDEMFRTFKSHLS